MKKILITAEENSCGNLKQILQSNPESVLHLPLEQYESYIQREESDALKALLHSFTFIVHGSLRNASFFMDWADEHGQFSTVQNQVHLVMDTPTAQYLEKREIPAIMPRDNARPIDIMEFMLRISKDGKTLYPRPEGKAEEMPGLLQELQLPMAEFTVCREKNLAPDQLKAYRKRLEKESPNGILLHNRASLTRTKAAFPDLNLRKVAILSGSPGVTNALTEMGVEPAVEAGGSWPSIQKIITDEILSERTHS
ncbi:MAG: hypothetical protein GVY08_05710 [Bacteroidetes bacterium]|jgi:uroporphyrinogen-III synthase|nr:hypothetical protein [Bacteroidota bacterium]